MEGTEGYFKILVVNERGEGQVNKKHVAINVIGARRIPIVTKKAVVEILEKHEPQEVIIISSNGESDMKTKQVSRRISEQSSSRRNAVKTLTQILTSRSKLPSDVELALLQQVLNRKVLEENGICQAKRVLMKHKVGKKRNNNCWCNQVNS